MPWCSVHHTGVHDAHECHALRKLSGQRRKYQELLRGVGLPRSCHGCGQLGNFVQLVPLGRAPEDRSGGPRFVDPGTDQPHDKISIERPVPLPMAMYIPLSLNIMTPRTRNIGQALSR